MRILKFSATLLTILAILSPVLAASGFESTGIGTRAWGMAGAFRAVADDWTAAYYNPAGYAYIQDNQLGGNLGLVHLRNELTPNYRYGGEYESGVFNDQINFNNHQIISNPSGGLLARLPIWGESVVGLSIYQPFDYNISWELYDMPAAYNDSLSVPGDQYTNNFDVVAFQATFSREFSEDKLSLGIGLQLLRADLRYTDITLRDNLYGAPLNDRPYDKITEYSISDGYGWGFGINAGMLMKVNDKLNLALTANMPFDITVSGRSRLEWYMPKNPTLAYSTDDPDIANPGMPENLFVSGTDIVDSADFEVEISLPPTFGFGLSYAVRENLTLAFDADYTLWSQFKGLNFVYSNHEGLTGPALTDSTLNTYLTTNQSTPVEWSDAMGFALGVTYDYKTLMTITAGGGYNESAAKESVGFVPQFIDTGDQYLLSGGITFHINEWDLGITSSYTSYPDLTVGSLVDVDGDGQFDNFPGLYKANTYETVLSFNYRF